MLKLYWLGIGEPNTVYSFAMLLNVSMKYHLQKKIFIIVQFPFNIIPLTSQSQDQNNQNDNVSGWINTGLHEIVLMQPVGPI